MDSLFSHIFNFVLKYHEDLRSGRVLQDYSIQQEFYKTKAHLRKRYLLHKGLTEDSQIEVSRQDLISFLNDTQVS